MAFESFYGGRMGASFVIVKHFDGIDIPENTVYRAKIYASNGDEDKSTCIYYVDSDNNLIEKTADNYMNNKYAWSYVDLDGSTIPANQLAWDPTLDPQPSGTPTAVSLGDPVYAEGMIQCFQKGGESTDIVNYGEYVIIDTHFGLCSKSDPDNGKVYRRGMNYQNSLGGAEYIGQIVGPQGESPDINFDTYDNVVDLGGNFDAYSVENNSLVPGKDSSGETVEYNDSIQYAWVNLRDEKNNIKSVVVGFKIPYLVVEFTGQARSAYYEEGDDIPSGSQIGDRLPADYPLAKLVDNEHPFYKGWSIDIPHGIKGDAIKDLELYPGHAIADTVIYQDKACTIDTGERVGEGGAPLNLTSLEADFFSCPLVEGGYVLISVGHPELKMTVDQFHLRYKQYNYENKQDDVEYVYKDFGLLIYLSDVDINTDSGEGEGSGSQKVQIEYSDSGYYMEIGKPLNYIIDTYVVPLDDTSTGYGGHLLVYYSDPEKRNAGIPIQFKGHDGWVDIGDIGYIAGFPMIIGLYNSFEDIPDSAPEDIMGNDKYTGWGAAFLETNEPWMAIYDYTQSEWTKGYPLGTGVHAFANLTDVDFDNLENNQVPTYNSTTRKWENKTIETEDTKVTQDPATTTDNGNFPILLGGTADNLSHTEGVKKSNGFAYNPNIYSVMEGTGVATGTYSHAEGGIRLLGGTAPLASGDYSHVEGAESTANGICAHAEGGKTIAQGNGSHAEGSLTNAIGDDSHAEGSRTIAQGLGSHAEGNETIAQGDDSHAEGFGTTASGGCAHVEGTHTLASSWYSHAEGTNTTAAGDSSHAEGFRTSAAGFYSHVEGNYTTAYGQGSHAEGSLTLANGINSHVEGSGVRDLVTSEVELTIASGDNSHAEGFITSAAGSSAHAEGNGTLASGLSSHAEGGSTIANGINSHAEGTNTCAYGLYTHAEGSNTYAGGEISHAEGVYTCANYANQHVQGYYNDNKSNTLFEVGNGTSSSRSNAFEVYADGSLSTDNGVTKVKLQNLINNDTKVTQTPTTTNANYEVLFSNSANDVQETDIVRKNSGLRYNPNRTSLMEGSNTAANGDASHAEGSYSVASGENSHAEGYKATASGQYTHAEGGYTRASDTYAHAEGNSTRAQGPGSHTEGYYTYATGYTSHAEGNETTARGNYSHAEGQKTVTNGNQSHAEGQETSSLGEDSHAEGNKTIANPSIFSYSGMSEEVSSPAEISDSGAVVYTSDNKVHIFYKGTNNSKCHRSWNGISWSSVLDTNSVYDYDGAIAVSNNKIYTFNAPGSSTYGKVWNGSTWTNISLPWEETDPLEYNCICAVGDSNNVYVFCSDNYSVGETNICGFVWNGSTWTHSWVDVTSEHPLSKNLLSTTAVVIDGEFHIFGVEETTGRYVHLKGQSNLQQQPFLSLVEVDAPPEYYKNSVTVLNGEIYLVGDGTLYKYSNTWELVAEIGSLPDGPGGAVVSYPNNCISVFGGAKESGRYKYQNICFHFSTTNAKNGHAEGNQTSAIGHNTHSGGTLSTAVEDNSMAIGIQGYTNKAGIDSNANLFAIGGSRTHLHDVENAKYADSSNNIFSVDLYGNFFSAGAQSLIHKQGIATTTPTNIVLEDGAMYILYANGIAITSKTGAPGTAKPTVPAVIAISAGYDPRNQPIDTASVGVPTTVYAAGTTANPIRVACTTQAYTQGSSTYYHSQIGLSANATNRAVRWNLVKVCGSMNDF